MSHPNIESLTTLSQAREAYKKVMTSNQEISAEAEALRDDLKVANEMIDELSAEKIQIEEKLQNALKLDEEKTTKFSQASAKIKDLESSISQLKAEAKSSELKAAEICASVGVEPASVSPNANTKDNSSIKDQFKAITDPAKQIAFFRKHREELIG